VISRGCKIVENLSQVGEISGFLVFCRCVKKSKEERDENG
jgi:hypothetical protein